MPKRQATRKVATIEIMGDDSYLVYRPITVQEQRELMTQSKEYQTEVEKHTQLFADALGKKVADLTDTEQKQALATLDNAEEMMHFMDKTLAERIIEWNWVDDNDESLPAPIDDWQVMLKLYSHEYEFIHSLFSNSDKTEKN